MRIYSIQRNREGWCAEGEVREGRFIGKLFSGVKLVRHLFDVEIRNGAFLVDIGTGSGVKIRFKVPDEPVEEYSQL